ncbi:MAG: hypothetical protein V3T24_03560 [Longimicrobiales bacterium]
MIGPRWRLLAPTAIVLLATACGGGSIPSPFDTGGGPHSRSARVTVTNHNWLDAVVHATRLGSRVRIGSVTSQSRRTFQIPVGFMGANGSVGLEVSLIGSSELFRTGELFVPIGQMVELDIQNQLSTSSWSILPE